MKRTLEQAIRENGLETEIRNSIYQLLRTANNDNKMLLQSVRFDGLINIDLYRLMNTLFNYFQNDSLSYLRRAGILWERRVRKSLNSMCTELEVTLQGQLRTSVEREELQNKWNELSNYQIG